MAKLTPKGKLGAARLLAKEKLPYFASGLYMLAPVWVPNGTLSQDGTMGVTDKWVLLVEEEALKRWNVDETAGALVHEMLHPLREHYNRSRAVGANTQSLQRIWNIAADCELNDDIAAAGLKLPDGAVFPSIFELEEGRTAEQYYRELLDKVDACPQCRGQLGAGDGDNESQGSDSQSGQSSNNQKDKGKCKGKGQKKNNCPFCSDHGQSPSAGNGWCGSGVGRPVPGEEDRSDEISDAERSKTESDSVKKKIAHDIQEQSNKSRGNIPSNWARWADTILQPPKIDWRTKLAHIARNAIAYRAGAVDFKYSRTSRRQSTLGYGIGCPRLPALLRPVPHVAIAIDTSGSMSSQDLRDAVSESEGILRSVGADVTFISCDADVSAMKRVTSVDDLVKNLVGGGGTDFTPTFQAIETLKPRPEVLIYFTDGCGAAPTRPTPGLHTIWALVGRYRQQPWFQGEPWGDIIDIDDLYDDEDDEDEAA